MLRIQSGGDTSSLSVDRESVLNVPGGVKLNQVLQNDGLICSSLEFAMGKHGSLRRGRSRGAGASRAFTT